MDHKKGDIMNEHIQNTEQPVAIPAAGEAVKAATKDAAKKQQVQVAEDLGTKEVLN